MIKVGRFGLAIATALAFGLQMSHSAMAWDFAERRGEVAAPSTASGFAVNQNVTVGVPAKIVTVHATQTLPTDCRTIQIFPSSTSNRWSPWARDRC